MLYEKYKKHLYKSSLGQHTFAQMQYKDIRNLYIKSISFFLIFNNRKTSRNIRK